jgi:hypothetical protein
MYKRSYRAPDGACLANGLDKPFSLFRRCLLRGQPLPPNSYESAPYGLGLTALRVGAVLWSAPESGYLRFARSLTRPIGALILLDWRGKEREKWAQTRLANRFTQPQVAGAQDAQDSNPRACYAKGEAADRSCQVIHEYGELTLYYRHGASLRQASTGWSG